MQLKKIVENVFLEALKIIIKEKNLILEDINKFLVKVERSREEKFGDYACTSAMDKQLREWIGIKNPKELANLWVEKIKAIKISKNIIGIEDKYLFFNQVLSFEDLFEDINIAGSGFINVFISPKLLLFYLLQAIDDNETYGNQVQKHPKNIIFEFVSANPTGPLNIVSARAAALGDSCCNLLKAAGHNVYREYYVNDYGNQVELLGISCLFRFFEKKGIKLKFSSKVNNMVQFPQEEGLPFPSEAYHGEYIKEVLDAILKNQNIEISLEELERLKLLSKRIDLKEDDLEVILNDSLKDLAYQLSRQAIEYFLNTQKEDLKNFRVHFDNFFLESSLHNSGKVHSILDDLKNYLYNKENKVYFKSTVFGDDQDRVVVRDNGKPTYLLADIAYHKSKMERGFTDIINIWGPDHHGYIARLKGAMKALGFPEDRFHILIAQQVTLLEDGKPVIMSKRAGKIIQMKELIEEVPVDVSRYFFVMRSFESHLDFDLNQAKDTSERNPYFYVAYAHARIESIFRKIEQEKIFSFNIKDLLNHDYLEPIQKVDLANFSYKIMFSEHNHFRRNLLLSLARFKEEIYDAAIYYEPHRLVFFVYQVANEFARFYSLKENKIIEKSEEEAKFLILLLYGVKILLKRGLNLLGMEAPDRLEREV